MDEYLICPECGKKTNREYVKVDDNSDYNFTLSIKYICECGYERIDT